MDTSRFIFGRNRAEEFPRDVWNRFVVPLFYDQLNFQDQTKALVIEGGRGCGKTTLLNYFCHPTRFSPERVDELTESDLTYIGLYYRADTNFLSGLQGDSHSEADFLAAFKHSLAYNIAMEVVESLESINQTDKRVQRLGKLDTLDFEHLGQLFSCDLGRTLSDFKKKLKSLKAQLASWLNNPGQIARPVFLPPQEFIVALVEYVRAQLPYLANSSFAVFIDEYENLLDYQKKVINTLLKHGQRPLLYNIAMKRNGFGIRDTAGPEQLQDIHDFTTVDLELHLENGFDLFAGELLLFKLLEQIPGLKDDLPIDPAILRSSEKASIDRRRDDAYRKAVLSCAGRVLPRQTERDLAAKVFDDQRLKGRLLDNLKKGLARWHSALAVDRFVREKNPQLTLVASALLARRKEKPESILQEMDAFERDEPNRFATSDWVHNNLFGALLQLYSAANVTCPLFAGFEPFVLISKGNIRHFLELCRRAFSSADLRDAKSLPEVGIADQAEVVRTAAYSFLGEIRGAGIYGNQLHSLALTLGALFRQKQRALEQSEPEINHFTISDGQVEGKLNSYLSEAIKWSVLYEEPETKMKNLGARTSEYILNPIFAGHFQISYRKRRAMQFTSKELLTMLDGTVEERDKLVRSRAGDADSPQSLELDFGGQNE